jgi:hypothetical protein
MYAFARAGARCLTATPNREASTTPMLHSTLPLRSHAAAVSPDDASSDLAAYGSGHPLLLVTPFAPGNQGGGAVIVRSLLEGAEERVVWASPEADTTGYDGPVDRLDWGRRPWLTPPGRLAQRIEALAEKHSAAAVWAVAHGPIVPALAPLAARSRRRLHLSVHDDPAWSVAFRGRRDRPLTPWIHHHFNRALRSSASIDVIGGGMRGAVAARAGRDSIVVHRVVPGPIAPNETPPPQDRVTMGLLGSVYHPRQLAQLAQALARAGRLVGLPAQLTVIGKEAAWMRSAVGDAGVEAEFLGHMSEADGMAHLRSAFALYVGYPFGVRERVMRRTSFPAKVATYVQAARPLLVHTPYDSTLTQLLVRRPFTIPWINQDVERGAETLAAAWRDPAYHASQHEAAESVRRAYFGADNRERMHAALRALVG